MDVRALGVRRVLWGVILSSRVGSEHPMLLAVAWDKDRVQHPDEPTRELLFKSREKARQWCRKQHARYKGNSVCAEWRFRPVRVKETVVVLSTSR